MQQWVSAVKSFVNIYYHKLAQRCTSLLFPFIGPHQMEKIISKSLIPVIITVLWQARTHWVHRQVPHPVELESNMPHVSFNSK